MTKNLCIALCLLTIVVALCVLVYVAVSTPAVEAEPTTVATTEVVTEETTEPATEVATIPETTAAETEPVVVETEPTHTVEELEMLALVIYQEAGGDACSDETRMMVGTVVMNRVADPRFPDTIYGVLTQRAQYGRLHWTGLVWPSRASSSGEAHAVDRAYACAERILQGERALPSDVIFQSEFIQGTEIVAYSDGMYFCR